MRFIVRGGTAEVGIEYFEFMDTFYCEVEDEIGKVVKQNGENLWIYEKQLGGKFHGQRALIKY